MKKFIIFLSIFFKKTYAATVKTAYRCTSGTLTYDANKGASSGGYICVTSNTTSYYSCQECSSWGYVPYTRSTRFCHSGSDCSSHGTCWGDHCCYASIEGPAESQCVDTSSNGHMCACSVSWTQYECTNYVQTTCESFGCPSGFSYYSGSELSTRCYRLATL